MNFSAVVATDLNGAIGLNGQLIYPISEDLKHFKKITSGHTVVLGRKTLETFPGKRPLPNRRNLILTHHAEFSCEGAEIFHSIDQVISAVQNDGEVFIIGGASVYQQFEPLLERIYLTRIFTTFESADTFSVSMGSPHRPHQKFGNKPMPVRFLPIRKEFHINLLFSKNLDKGAAD